VEAAANCELHFFFPQQIRQSSISGWDGQHAYAEKLCMQAVFFFPAFLTQKALGQHCRVKHKAKHPMSLFAPISGICLACRTDFKTRLRLMRHLCDKRRPKCRHAIESGGFQPLTNEEVEVVVVAERALLKEARSQGHSHVLAKSEARRADGRIAGRVHK